LINEVITQLASGSPDIPPSNCGLTLADVTTDQLSINKLARFGRTD